MNESLSDHLYGLNPLGRRGHYLFYLKKSTLGA
jgi:hypothetical protein